MITQQASWARVAGSGSISHGIIYLLIYVETLKRYAQRQWSHLNKDGGGEGIHSKEAAGGMLGRWGPSEVVCCPTYYLSSIIVLFIFRRSRRKRFLKKVDPRDLFPVPIRFYLYLWYLVQMRTYSE